MTDKMEPVAYTDATELKAVKDCAGLMWRTPLDLPKAAGQTALYTADQVKELTERLEVAEYKLNQAVNVTGLMLQRRAERAETALAEARKVIETARWSLQPFSDHVYNDNGDFAVSGMSQVSDQAFIEAYFVYKSASRWLQANKGGT
jgi:hypothetical protein